jgi:hypothetical protein
VTELPAPPFSDLPLNAHVHLPPNFSAFDSVSQAIELAAGQGLWAFGASNYYDYTVYRELEERAREAGIYPLFGLEIISLVPELQAAGVKINDPGNPGKYYLCGKGITEFAPMNSAAAALLGTIRENDSRRMSAMVERLSEVCGAAGLSLGLTEAAVKAGIVARHGCPPETVFLQERHVAQAFQEALFAQVPMPERASPLERLFGAASKAPDDAVTVQNEIRSHLMKAGRPAFVEETFVGFDHAYQLVLALSGIPCYPTLADGANPICGYEDPVESLIADIKRRGIHCAELIPIRNRPEVLEQYVVAMREAGLFVTAGTEHNTPDLIPLQPHCLGSVPVPERLRAIFWEGTCVLAAHQERRRRGEPGFVDGDGAPCPGFSSADDRIEAFAREGAEIILAAQEV